MLASGSPWRQDGAAWLTIGEGGEHGRVAADRGIIVLARAGNYLAPVTAVAGPLETQREAATLSGFVNCSTRGLTRTGGKTQPLLPCTRQSRAGSTASPPYWWSEVRTSIARRNWGARPCMWRRRQAMQKRCSCLLSRERTWPLGDQGTDSRPCTWPPKAAASRSCACCSREAPTSTRLPLRRWGTAAPSRGSVPAYGRGANPAGSGSCSSAGRADCATTSRSRPRARPSAIR